MSAAVLLQAWADTLVTTGLLVLLILIVRKPFARHFGPRLTYALWAVPALRLVLPPLPFADPVVIMPEPAADMAVMVPVGLPVAAPAAAEPLWTLVELVPLFFALWAAGMIAVIVTAMVSHRRFRRAVLGEAVELEPIGNIRLVMSDAVDGPVAFGLWQRYVAVPHDFFARYVAEERALAIDHELSHHRHGDLWANSAALVLLAAQWFNPFAWRAIRAFRFDQEAACDARVLTMTHCDERRERTARYATAIVKAAVGPRLSLAAPMAVHDNLQERLTMLTQGDISKKRGLVGRLLIGSATLAVLGATATLVPAGIVVAKAQTADLGEPPAPPAPPEPPLPPEAPDAPGTMVFTEHSDDAATDDGKKKREVHRIVIRRDGDSEGKALADGKDKMRRIEIRSPGGLSRDDVIATLKEQGITGKRAEAIADKLEAKRKERIRTVMAPMHPMPPMPPMHGTWSTHGKAMVLGKCGDGKAAPIVNRDENSGNKRSHVMMFACSDGPEAKAARLSALKKAREAFADGERARGLSEDMRAKVAADLEKAIAEIEKSGH
ncbi:MULTISPECIES: M56 family metallopeptidase [unclassified Sphingopyxis]|uniref:M56 family metallopeptidase n=1 Tax=unclassified Sphingopyxis TaxID=2614943 RepID=UPI002861062A|nr:MULTISPECIES: M56 family metallopeptidase [unclassified Sphingopyxis]MDR7058936.1 beta-lactamase regulating signal transducer with metallopeptidase domain [Sphingopyxis sp. BE235]MDR7178878.1 beta-lactamase regulating signal transducer with metallopeptidase domain [Sphingopyxis sp. BE249]